MKRARFNVNQGFCNGPLSGWLPTYALGASTWLAIAAWGSQAVYRSPLWAVCLLTLLFALPIFAAAVYGVTIRRIRRAHLFNSSGVLHALLTGRWLASLLWLLWSLLTAYLMLFYLGTATAADWWLVILSIALFPLLVLGLGRLLQRELKPYLILQTSLASARWLFALLLALLQLWIIAAGDGSPAAATLAQSLEHARGELPELDSNSLVVRETAHWMAYHEAFRGYTLTHLSALSTPAYLLLLFIGSFTLFFNLSLGLSCFMIPPAEYQRVFAPLTDTDRAPPPASSIIAGSAALLAFSLLFLFLPLVAYTELWLTSQPPRMADLHQASELAIIRVEQIEQRYYRPGTIEQINTQQLATLAEIKAGYHDISEQADHGYTLMAANIEGYLDWYYSLPAEYTRIFALVSGNIEQMMAEQLEAYLGRGNPFGDLEQTVTETMRRHEDIQRQYREKVEDILASNQLETGASSPLQVDKVLALEGLVALPPGAGLDDVGGRLLASSATGAAITGLIAAKVTAKAVGKGTIKLGAKALAKVAASKASGALGGTAAGAAAGAAAGTVIPGIGTVIGGVVGGIIGGIAVGVGVEALLLLLEETLSRETFRLELLQSIEEARAEFQDRIQAAAAAAGKAPGAEGIKQET